MPNYTCWGPSSKVNHYSSNNFTKDRIQMPKFELLLTLRSNIFFWGSGLRLINHVVLFYIIVVPRSKCQGPITSYQSPHQNAEGRVPNISFILRSDTFFWGSGLRLTDDIFLFYTTFVLRFECQGLITSHQSRCWSLNFYLLWGPSVEDQSSTITHHTRKVEVQYTMGFPWSSSESLSTKLHTPRAELRGPIINIDGKVLRANHKSLII